MRVTTLRQQQVLRGDHSLINVNILSHREGEVTAHGMHHTATLTRIETGKIIILESMMKKYRPGGKDAMQLKRGS